MTKFKKYLFIFVTTSVALFGTFGWVATHPQIAKAACGNGYSYCNTITTVHSKAGSADTSNFTMLFATSTMSSLATVAHGGNVQNTTTQTGGGASLTVPADLVFTSDSACTTKLSFEWETYNSTTGNTVAWVKIGTLSHTSDVTIYLCYGNSSVTTWQGNVNSTWDSSYGLVTHLPTTTVNDSTSNANNGSNTNMTAGTGQIDGAITGNGLNSAIDMPSGPTLNPSSFTLECWFNRTTLANVGNGDAICGKWESNQGYMFWDGATNNLDFHTDTSDLGTLVTITNGTWYDAVATFDGSTLTTYVNGVSQTSGTRTVTNTASPFEIGRYAETDTTNWNGLIDEVRLSNVVRSASYITAHYNNENSPGTFYVVGAQQSGGVVATNGMFFGGD